MSIHNVFHIKLLSPLHLGSLANIENTENIIHSDTIFSALANITGIYFGEKEYSNFIQPFLDGTPSYLISSAFPFIDVRDNPLYLFPKPLLLKDFINEYPENIKDYKKISFISKELFEAFLKKDDDFLREQFLQSNGKIKRDNFIQGGKIWLSESERDLAKGIEKLWNLSNNPRVMIDRISRETSIFHYSRVFFHEKAGLYFMVKILDDSKKSEIIDQLTLKLNYLSDRGIGGEKSIGNGQFEIKSIGDNVIEINEPSESSYFITLSYFFPAKKNIKNIFSGDVFYELIQRGGWISGTSYMKKSIKMLSEGSILKNGDNRRVYGRIADLTPQILEKGSVIKVYRYGYGYPILIKI
ncbi:MAG: type III-A CRISPR-associated RAMP protein Csm4 [Promethearchaeota archaeon]